MKILTEEELAMKLDFRRPLHVLPEPARGAWCIPFEYGENEKGTRISIPKAKQIAAELLREVAEAEKRELFDAFQSEKKRAEEVAGQLSRERDVRDGLQREVADLKIALRARRKKTVKADG